MKIIVFDIKAKFAHFRKFYTNSSSLTYGIPPRTAICGILAAILGLERDSYYEKFSSKKVHIAVKKLNSTRKIMQTLNYIRATSMSELIKPRQHTQVPFEVLVGENGVNFRIYLGAEDGNLLRELEKRLKENRTIFPPYLGSANFGCSISYVGRFEGKAITNDDMVSLNTVVRSDQIKDIDISEYSGRLIKERMAADFSIDRTINRVETYIYDDDGKPIDVKLKDEYISLTNGEYIVFM